MASGRVEGTDLSNDSPFVVTGASGYAASWIVNELLKRGATVRATVRDPSNEEKCRHLVVMGNEHPGTLELAKADLLDPGAFDRVVDGARVVIHTASPFIVGKVTDPQAQLVEPALSGTKNVLQSVERATSVEKVVVTSSVAAIYGDAVEASHVPGGRFTEEHWNTSSSADHQPYSYSKTVAERSAWEMCNAQGRWKLATINPGFVLGPSKTPRADSESIKFMRDLIRGRYKFGAPPLSFGIVDVRDVATAHVEAAIRPFEGRAILVAGSRTILDMGLALRARLGASRPFPTRPIPTPLLYLFGPPQGFSWKFLRDNAGHPIDFDTTRSTDQLGMRYRPIDDTLADHAEQLIEAHAARQS
ncbi:MAG: NAD-dependent epimerase/dehydratase family protein [Myxococcota bacterium]